MKNYVIIGNGTAAVGCIEGIRSIDKDGRITVVSAEAHPVYSRPLISYYLEDKTDLERIKYRPDGFYEDNGCEVLYGVSALSVDPEKQTVSLSNGDAIGYDELCVAAGSSPFVPPMQGLETVENRFSFMTLDDALALEKALAPDSRVFIIGAGLIGLKCAEGIFDKVGKVTVCDLSDRILSSIFDAGCAGFVQKYLEEKGMEFLLSDSVDHFDGNTAFMKSGATVGFDILITAVGVRANISLVKDIGGECTRGIVCDTRMKTSVEHIYAAGDCAETFDSSSGENKVMALLPNAYAEGFTAGVNMAGGDSSLDNEIPMNSIGFFGLHTMSAGLCDPEKCEAVEESGQTGIRKFYIKDNLLRGFRLIGNIERAGIYTSMIRNKIPLDTVDFESLKKMPELFFFGEKYRRNVLGRTV